MSKHAELVKYLHKLTLAGKLIWTETAEEDVFQASFPKYSIHITETPTTFEYGDPEETDIVISIFNDQGRRVEEFRDWDGSAKEPSEEQPFKIMKETYAAARRQALNIDDALDNLLSELKEIDLPF